MTLGLINANPVVHAKKERVTRTEDLHNDVFKVFLDIRDPEHPYSLEQLSVLSEESITVDEKLGRILITFTPTIQHCSMATVIGLCLREKMKDYVPPHFKVDIKVAPGSHADEESVNKQLNDKERVAAALENPNLRQLVDECLYSNKSNEPLGTYASDPPPDQSLPKGPVVSSPRIIGGSEFCVESFRIQYEIIPAFDLIKESNVYS
ncbi:hypothetical protein Fot_56140 [Forsythia ovata]|uniref:MIP18 family-like domain-containing protein n=1 Tax=Forsythia ovata TaxID=205694 RepID=A0ABD1P164_9LAMI